MSDCSSFAEVQAMLVSMGKTLTDDQLHAVLTRLIDDGLASNGVDNCERHNHACYVVTPVAFSILDGTV